MTVAEKSMADVKLVEVGVIGAKATQAEGPKEEGDFPEGGVGTRGGMVSVVDIVLGPHCVPPVEEKQGQ